MRDLEGRRTEDDLVLSATFLPAGESGVLYLGTQATLLPFGNGLRCAGGQTWRFPVRPTGTTGTIVEGPGLSSFLPPGTLQAGATYVFQAWYRDPAGPCGGNFNTSSAVGVTFAP